MRIRWCLSGFVLPCGCVGGTYETYDGDIVSVIDAHDGGCSDPRHVAGAVVASPPDPAEIPVSDALHRRAEPKPAPDA